MASWDDVRRIALGLPGAAEEVCRDGHRTWRVRGHSFAWERPLGQADLAELGAAPPEGPLLAVRVADVAAQEALVAAAPGVCSPTAHSANHPAVLVRLDAIGAGELEELLAAAHACRQPVAATLRTTPH